MDFKIYEEKRKKIDSHVISISKLINKPKLIYKKIVNCAVKLVDGDRGCIKYYNKSEKSNEALITRKYPQKCINSPTVNYIHEPYRDPDISSQVVKIKESIIISNIHICQFKDPKMTYYKDYIFSRISNPIKINNDIIGVLSISHKEEDYFNDLDRIILCEFAEKIAMYFQNAILNEQHQKNIKSQKIIFKLIEHISTLQVSENIEEQNHRNLNQIIEIILRETGKVFNADSGFLAFTGFKDNKVVSHRETQFGLGNRKVPNTEILEFNNNEIINKHSIKSISGKVIGDGNLYNCNNTKHDEYYLQYSKKDKIKSEIAVPLKFQGNTFGVFVLDSIYSFAFSKNDEEILISISNQIALLVKRYYYLGKLKQLSEPLKIIDDSKKLYHEICKKTCDILNTKISTLRIIDREELIVKGFNGLMNKNLSLPIKIGKGITGKVAESFIYQTIKDIQVSNSDYIHKEFAQKNKLYAMISVPIFSYERGQEKQIIGVLNTYANRRCEFTQMDIQLMQLIANKAGESMKKATLIEKLGIILKKTREFEAVTEREMLQQIAQLTKEIMNADLIILYQFDKRNNSNFGFKLPPIKSGTFISDIDITKQKNISDGSFAVKFIDLDIDEKFIPNMDNNEFVNDLYIDWESAEIKSKANKKFYEREKIQSAIFLKLKFKDELIGIIFINFRYKKDFSIEEKRITTTLANSLAYIIHNIRKYQEIAEIAKTIVTEPNIRNILQMIADNSLDLLNADNVMLYKYNPLKKETENPVIFSGKVFFPKFLESNVNKHDVQINVINNGDTLFESDVTKSKVLQRQKLENDRLPFIEREKIISTAAIVLKVGNNKIGLMFVNYRKKQKFDPDQRDKIQFFANQAAIAIRNSDLFRKLDLSKERIEKGLIAIRESGNKIVENLKKEKADDTYILQPILDQALKLNNVDMGYISLCSGLKYPTVAVYSDKYMKLKNKSIKIDYPIAKWIEENVNYLIVNNISVSKEYLLFNSNPELISDDPDFTFVADENVKSALVVPIHSDNTILGMIFLESEEPNAFTENDAGTVVSLANQASMALQIVKQRELLIAREKEANYGSISRESVHWVGNKIGPIRISIDIIRQKLSELQKENKIDQEEFEYLENFAQLIQHGAISALSIKSDLIDPISKLSYFDIINLLNKVVADYRIGSNIPIIIISKFNDKEFYITSGKKYIEKIFNYILKNAIQAIEDKQLVITEEKKANYLGEILITIKKSEEEFIISIKDNGCGIKAENVDKLFNPFYTTKGADRGSGVGLFFCKRTMQDLNGKIEIQSKENVETTVKLVFPLKIK